MCTVTYVPACGERVVTANRDEVPFRNADGLSLHSNVQGSDFFIAKEPLHGGTNLAIGANFTTVLLNGAFYDHRRQPNYRKSRGLIVLDSLNLETLNQLKPNYLAGVESFTLLRFGSRIEELRWDEMKVYFRTHDPRKSLIVASAKLYDSEVLEKRQIWFNRLFESGHPDRNKIWDFHLNGGDGDPENDMNMNRMDMVRTVSITQVSTSTTEKQVKHLDLVREKEKTFTLES